MKRGSTQWFGYGPLCLAVVALFHVASCSTGETEPAAESLELSDATEKYDLVPHLLHFEDTSGRAQLSDVRHSFREDFVRSGPELPAFSYTDSAFWFRLDFRSSTGFKSTRWYLEHTSPSTDHIDVFIIEDNRLIASYVTGDALPFRARPVRHRYFYFPFLVSPEHEYEVYVRVAGGDSIELPLELISARELARRNYRINLWEGLYYGVMSLLLLSNLMFFFFTRDRGYILYVGYILTVVLFILGEQGFGYQYLWPWSPYFQNHALPSLAPLGLALSVFFSIRFLGLRKRFPQWHRVGQVLGSGLFILALGGALLPHAFTIPIILVLSPLIPILGILVGWKIYRSGFAPALFFMLAWAALAIGVVVYALMNFDLIAYGFFQRNAVRLGTLFEVILLSFALSSRVGLLRKERDLLRVGRREMEQRTASIERDLMQAHAIQRNLMPDTLPDVAGLKIQARFIPLETVGGDFYGFVPFASGDLGVFIADVSGHGIGAAMVALMVREQMDSWAHVINSPSETILQLNEHLIPRAGGNFVTFFYAIIKSDRIVYANAGHHFPILITGKNETTELRGRGRLMGIYHDIRCEDRETPFGPGDRLALYTDGVIEIGHGDKPGETQLLELLQESRDLEGDAMMDQIMGGLIRFNDDLPFADDVTMIVVDRRGD